MQQLMGLAYGDDEDVDKFLTINPYEMKLTAKSMREISALQRQVAKDRGGNPDVRSALAGVQSMLIASGVNMQDKEVMARFRGAFVDGYYDWKKQNPGKVMQQEDMNTIAARLLVKAHSPSFGLPWSTDFTFNLPLPPEVEEQLRAANPNPSDALLEQWRMQFAHKQFEAATKKSQERWDK
jgi:hypothetical protein